MSVAVIVVIMSCACEPRPAELSFEVQSNDWLMLNSTTREQLIHRTIGEYQVSGSEANDVIESDTIRFTESDGVTLVSRFDEPKLNRLREFILGAEDLAVEAKVITAKDRALATCHCNLPQSPARTFVVDGAACPVPTPTELHVYDPSSGAFTVRRDALAAEEQRWLLGLASSPDCASFVGTESLLDRASASTMTWTRVNDLPMSSNVDDVVLASGPDGLLVAQGDEIRVQWTSESNWVLHSLTAGKAASATSVPLGADGLEFWVLAARDNGDFDRAQLTLRDGRDPSVPVVLPTPFVVHADLRLEAESLFQRVSPKAVVARDVEEGLVLLTEDTEHVKVEKVSLEADPVAPDAARWIDSAEAEVLSTHARQSTWLVWSSQNELAFAWIMPASGAEAANVYVATGVNLGQPKRIVALDEDRIVLAFEKNSGLELWEWLQLPSNAEHDYDQSCEKQFGSFCLRPFPTSTARDGRVSCASGSELVHAWATRDRGVGLLYADGHVWRSGADCEQISGPSSPIKATSTESGRTLIVDVTGAYWLSNEEFRG